jgi:hypothetical protein
VRRRGACPTRFYAGAGHAGADRRGRPGGRGLGREGARILGLPRSFSPSSGWELDRFFDDQLKAPGEPKRGGLLAEDVGPRLFAIGAYVGEIIRRHSTGWKWVPDKDDPDDEINLSLRRGDEVVWPIQRVMKRYGEGEESGIAIYLVSVAELDVGPRPAG